MPWIPLWLCPGPGSGAGAASRGPGLPPQNPRWGSAPGPASVVSRPGGRGRSRELGAGSLARALSPRTPVGALPQPLAGAPPQAPLRPCPGWGEKERGTVSLAGTPPPNPRWGSALGPASVVSRPGVRALSRRPGASSGHGVQSLGVKPPEPGWGGGVPPSPSALLVLRRAGSGDVPLSSPSGV
ncbi:translation initiation factor IF-2 [Streptomyces malaysiensis]|uniref:Translation initiation factor IF-2 n=1 Tax=Streptomyces malaysiensis TaxID=92644 RepID=A0A7X6AZ62_STRMQ|nr:translation initiation factor IF-2 [Streptomyces malaysiensis]